MNEINVLKNSVTGEYITCNDPNKIIEVYTNQKKSDWMEIPSNMYKQYVSPFHMSVNCDKESLMTVLKDIDIIINYLFKLNNSSCIIMQQSRKSVYRFIYPELFLLRRNEKILINTIQQYIKNTADTLVSATDVSATDVSVSADTDTYLPNSGTYKIIGMYNNGVITNDDVTMLTSLNGIQFSQSLGQINYTINKQETPFKQH